MAPVLNGVNGLPELRGRTQVVAQQTGMLSTNRTQDLNVLGTDLGGTIRISANDTVLLNGVVGEQTEPAFYLVDPRRTG